MAQTGAIVGIDVSKDKLDVAIRSARVAAMTAWRNVEHHRAAQKRGCEGVFRDYRLRIAGVVRDYAMTERTESPADSRVANG